MNPVYEDVRVVPRDSLSQDLMECTLEGSVDNRISVEPGELNIDWHEAPQNTVSSIVAGPHKRSAARPLGT